MSQLIILKTHKNNKFSVVNLIVAEDQRLSWKAKGLHLYLISRPAGWKIRYSDLLTRATDGKTSLQSAVGELKAYGYLVITQVKEKGKFGQTIWEVFEAPQVVENTQSAPYPDFVDTEKPYTEKPYTENQHYYYIPVLKSTNTTNNHNNNNEVVVVDKDSKDLKEDDQSVKEILNIIENSALKISPKRISSLCAKYGVDRVYEVIDVLAWQYRNNTIKNPDALVSSILRKKVDIDIPSDYIPYKKRLKEAERQEEEDLRGKQKEQENLRKLEMVEKEIDLLKREKPNKYNELYKSAIIQLPTFLHENKMAVNIKMAEIYSSCFPA